MQEANIVTNTYWSDNARFADIMNVGMFQSKKILSAEQLSEKDVFSSTMIGKEAKKKEGVQKYRDVVRKAAFDTNFVLMGIENQTEIHYVMPVRIMGYDFLDYEKQWKEIKKIHKKQGDLFGAEYLSGFSKEDKLSPICTLVLYYGEEPWDGPRKLSDLLNFGNLPEEVREMVADYPIHVLDMRRFKESEKLETDARLLFGVMQRDGDIGALEAYAEKNKKEFANLSDDTFETIAVLTKTTDFIEVKKSSKNEKGGIDMCEAIRQLKEQGRVEGRIEGRIEGKIEGRIEGRIEGKIESIFELLSDLGEVSEEVKEKISNEKDTEVLRRWNKLVAKAETIEGFEQAM